MPTKVSATNPTTVDARCMRRALALARRAWGCTSPNPLVGAVIVSAAGKIIGEGWHQQAGTPHAEVHALAAAGKKAQGATLYVTLEPCCTQGRTPPCTAAILAAGIRRVVVGCLDPNPQHAGRGITMLQEHDVDVVTGVEKEKCQELNRAFFHWVTTGRPLVLLKLGMTLDGRIATATGQSQWITCPAARAAGQKLRRWADAILVGGETVRLDNPQLTVRTPPNWWRQPQKIVWTRRGPEAFPRALRIWSEPANPPLFVRAQTRTDWLSQLQQLGAQNVTAVLVEGGGELAASLLRAGVVDEVVMFVAPKILGGRNSRPAVGGADPATLAEALELENMQVRRVRTDLMITATPKNRPPIPPKTPTV